MTLEPSPGRNQSHADFQRKEQSRQREKQRAKIKDESMTVMFKEQQANRSRAGQGVGGSS